MNLFKRAVAGAALAVASVTAFAAPTDYTTMVNTVDFSTVITGLLAIGAVIMAVMVVRKGIRMIMGML
jgi:hypothetical protein